MQNLIFAEEKVTYKLNFLAHPKLHVNIWQRALFEINLAQLLPCKILISVLLSSATYFAFLRRRPLRAVPTVKLEVVRYVAFLLKMRCIFNYVL